MASWASRELKLRAASGLVLAPVAVAAVVIGGALFQGLVAGTVLLMAWEWERICNGGRFGAPGYAMAAAGVAVVVAAALGRPDVALWIVLVAAVAVFVAAGLAGRSQPLWTAFGMLVIGPVATTIIWLRLEPAVGTAGLLWLVGVVCATDLGGYAVGRTVGGPRLAPVISPRKTWSGLAGGMVCAAAWGWTGSQIWHIAAAWKLAFLAIVLAVLAQAGDLAVSVVKRRYGVKDSSNLIPGHGGVLDRTDGFVITTPVLAILIVTMTGGFGA
ncbi:MAG: phosphatidate cytidylyltransferase [Rhodospirillales bacterium]